MVLSAPGDRYCIAAVLDRLKSPVVVAKDQW
jgi:hypothetical protein